MRPSINLDAPEGVEPSLPVSETGVLPLDDRAIIKCWPRVIIQRGPVSCLASGLWRLAHSKGIKPLSRRLECLGLSESRVHKLVQCQGIEPCEPKQPGYSRRPLHRGLTLHWGDCGIRTLPVRVTTVEVPSTQPQTLLILPGFCPVYCSRHLAD